MEDQTPFLWSSSRREKVLYLAEDQENTTQKDVSDGDSTWRSPFQRDYDRILFSTPVRRLSDKTQVWPMDENDGVRTRLTHSHEVANLARSLGSRIASQRDTFPGADLHNTVQPILLAIGLAHDLGNPPFGHQGEAAIGSWFEERKDWIFQKQRPDGELFPDPLTQSQQLEFTKFDGNPQTLRLVTQLQTHSNGLGLDLCAATLAAMLKYPVSANNGNKSNPAHKKIGYFETERDIVRWIRDETGLTEKQRHPLTWIMEACDDIAYSILDVDDVMKKGIVSPEDVLSQLQGHSKLKKTKAVEKIKAAFKSVDYSKRAVFVTRDVKIGYMRAYLMDALMSHATQTYLGNQEKIASYAEDMKPLMEDSDLCEFLKDIAKDHAFSNSNVLRSEAIGGQAIKEILSFFWDSILNREEVGDIQSRRTDAKSKFAWSLISPNYIEQAGRNIDAESRPKNIRYAELRLLTDMVSGMTDTFAMKLWESIRSLPQ